MEAIAVHEPGGPQAMVVASVAAPAPLQPTEVLIRVHATAVNRADTLQRMGRYPAPPGASSILGLECSGVVEAIGSQCERDGRLSVGDRVMALLGGGGYAGLVVADCGSVMRVPDALDLTTAAGVPETWLTAYQLLHLVAEVRAGDRVLIHAAASGVGTAAIQLARAAGAVPFATVGSDAKVEYCNGLGAERTVNRKAGDWELLLQEESAAGFDVILDCVGADYAARNARMLATEGRWVLYGLLGGAMITQEQAPFPLGLLLRKRASIRGTTLRARTDAYKADLVARFSESSLGLLRTAAAAAAAAAAASSATSPTGTSSKQECPAVLLIVVVDKVFEGLMSMPEAHTYVEASKNMGKVVVVVDPTVS